MDFAGGKFNIEKLTGAENWRQWKTEVEDQLVIRGVYDVILTEQIEPKKPVAEQGKEIAEDLQVKYLSDLNKFRLNISTARAVLYGCIDSGIKLKVAACVTPFQIWTKLCDIYEHNSTSRLRRLLNQVLSAKMEEGTDMSTHLAAMRSTWADLQRAAQQEEKVCIPECILIECIFKSLPQVEFKEFNSLWDTMAKSERTVDKLEQLLLERASRELVSGVTDNSVGLLAKSTGGKPKSGGKANGNKGGVGKFKSTVKCFVCKELGHYKRDCPKYKAGNTGTGNGESLVCVEVSLIAQGNDDSWYPDTGATRHVTNCPDKFVKYKAFAKGEHSIKVGSGEQLEVSGQGDLMVEIELNGCWEKTIIRDVWFVKGFSNNLFSVMTSICRNPTYEFKTDRKACQLVDTADSNSVKLYGDFVESRGLFKLRLRVLKPEIPSSALLATKSPCNLQLWHERMGHLNKKQVAATLREIGYVVEDITKNGELCEGCVFGKMTRHSFGTRVERASKPGERIHSDLWGPAPVDSIGGRKYYVTFKDEFTNYRQVYFIKKKSETVNCLKEFLSFCKSQGHLVRELLSDNGTEYINDEFRKVTTEAGLNHRKSMPYTPEQNGMAERENRTLMESARAMLHSKAKLPESLWAEAVNTTVYVLNRTAATVVKGKTPIELFEGKRKPIDHLRIFGTECYVHTPAHQRSKLDKKAKKGFLVGYMGDKDGYRIYVPAEHRTVCSVSVTFNPEICCIDVPLVSKEETTQESVESKVEPDIQSEPEISPAVISTVDGSDSESESEPEVVSKADTVKYGLRNRTELKPPARFREGECFSCEDLQVGLAMIVTEVLPITAKQAFESQHSAEWKVAMEDELGSMLSNKVYKLVNLPQGRRAIGCRWVFCVKENSSGDIERYKARLVAKGFSQKSGIDYSETFAPVARFDSVRIFLSFVADRKLYIRQCDVKTAFLHGNLDEEIYMVQPEGFNDGSGKVWRLLKSLYGLKQSPRCWNFRVDEFLKNQGFNQTAGDHCLYTYENGADFLAFILYVDDGLIAGSSKDLVDQFLADLAAEFEITSGVADTFLGMQIEQYQDGSVFIHQTNYIKRILNRFEMEDCKAVRTPAEKPDSSEEGKVLLSADVPYRTAVGSLMFAACNTRADIAFAVNKAAQAVVKPTVGNWQAVKRILRYLKGTENWGIFFRGGESSFMSFSDADYAGCLETRRSTSGVVCKIGTGAVNWMSRKQQSVSTSTTEAELMAASDGAKEVIWISRVWNELHSTNEAKLKIPILFVDNMGTIKLIRNNEFHRRTKHIEIRHFWVRERCEEGSMDVDYVSSEGQVADIMTKPLGPTVFVKLRAELGMMSKDEVHQLTSREGVEIRSVD